MTRSRRFLQLDVFTAAAMRGNPLAVVVDGDGLDDETMQRFAAWTNLSETTFLLPPDDPLADYRVRIFTPDHEMPFAGHPTLGSCMAWLHSGGAPKQPGLVRQSCPIGIVDIDVSGARPAFFAPDTRIAPVEDGIVQGVVKALGLGPDSVVNAVHLHNGPEWVLLELASVAELLNVDRTCAANVEIPAMALGLIAQQADDADTDYEVRMFSQSLGGNVEDPITGSLNAAIACWLREHGRLPMDQTVTVAQGTCLDREGRVYFHVSADDPKRLLIGGDVQQVIEGVVQL